MKNIMKKLKNKKGFTLIELIVVIAILGILAAVAIPQLTGLTDTARENADHSTYAQVQNAVALAVARGEVAVPATGTSTIQIRTDANGDVTFGGTAVDGTSAKRDIDAIMKAMFSKAPKFQLTANKSLSTGDGVSKFEISSDGTIKTTETTGTKLK